MATEDTVAFLGGSEVFGRPIVSELELAAEVARGFPSASLDRVRRSLQSESIPRASLYALLSSSHTLQRRTQPSRDESDRIARLAREGEPQP